MTKANVGVLGARRGISIGRILDTFPHARLAADP
jgi:hypothetical protein